MGVMGIISTGFDWLTAGFGVARSPEEKKLLTQATVNLLNGADANTVQRLLKKNPPEFMKVFLYYRLSQIDQQKGQSDAARQSLTETLESQSNAPAGFGNTGRLKRSSRLGPWCRQKLPLR